MRFFPIITWCLAGWLGLAIPAGAGDAEQKLVEAAFRLDAAGVKALLKKGADPNAKYGKRDGKIFGDGWNLGYSKIGSENWTALLAVVHASDWPPPPREIENTIEDMAWARTELAKTPRQVLEKRRQLKLEIASLLVDAGADLDVDDGYGATALYQSAGGGSGVVEKGAKVNTRTGVYIDGPGDTTPLQRAVRQPEDLAALIQAGAILDAQDSTGRTALHAAVSFANLASVKLLLDAGAKPDIRDDGGFKPSDLITERERMPPAKRLILKLLRSAEGKPRTAK